MVQFSPQERRRILAFVRDVIGRNLAGAELPEVPELPRLMQPGACFVTLKEEGELRGCIGNLDAFEPLGENLIRNAVNASEQDPRFPPLDPEELMFVTLELSILSAPEPIASPEDFTVGLDGVVLSCGSRRAVFLPQVAVEQGWDRETTLFCLAHKAGLEPDAWRRPDCRLSVFRAEVFGESGTALNC